MNTAPLQLAPQYALPGAGGVKASHYFPDKVRLLDVLKLVVSVWLTWDYL